MGAEHVDAIEIDEYAFDNLKDNIKLNQADWVTPYQGGSKKIPDEATYDFIVANVTRGIILEKKLKFWDHLKPGGRILISGILETDREDVISQYVDQGFYSIESMKIGKWCALMFGKRKRTKVRSEEHTSELQSRGHLVCRLLLEKTIQTLTFGVMPY